MRRKEDSKQHELKVQFLWYGTTNKRDKSGAYLFLPDGQGQVSAAAETGTAHVCWNCRRDQYCASPLARCWHGAHTEMRMPP